mmetsp:Transcript_11244/g.26343  ORF Transcript_11244/g.26343 Transcript_11244/m.26343 type:complete len:218 (-) Transcript_11244:7-660(-)
MLELEVYFNVSTCFNFQLVKVPKELHLVLHVSCLRGLRGGLALCGLLLLPLLPGGAFGAGRRGDVLLVSRYARRRAPVDTLAHTCKPDADGVGHRGARASLNDDFLELVAAMGGLEVLAALQHLGWDVLIDPEAGHLADLFELLEHVRVRTRWPELLVQLVHNRPTRVAHEPSVGDDGLARVLPEDLLRVPGKQQQRGRKRPNFPPHPDSNHCAAGA